MTPYVTEILKEVSNNPELLNTKYKDVQSIRVLLQYAFDEQLKFVLPEGTPPFKPDAAPIGMNPTNFHSQVKKLYIFTRADLTPVRREQLFIQLLEGLHPTEAEVCIHIKDQTLTKAYPGITSDLVVKAGIVKEENIFRVDAPAVITKGKHLVVNLSDAASSKESFGAPPVAPVEAVVAETVAKVRKPRVAKVK